MRPAFALSLLLLMTSPVLAQQTGPSPAPAPPPAPYPTAAPPVAPGPFTLPSADGQSRLKVGGMIQTHVTAYTGGRTGNSAFTLRRVRPILDGTLYNWVDFRLMPDFGEGKVVLQDAFIELRLRPQVHLRTGKFKVPYSLERLQAAADVLFVERSLAGNVIPVRDVGVMLMGVPGKSGFEWEVGAFNGVYDSGATDGNGDNALELAGRLFYQPFQSRPESRLKGLGFGIAGTTGSAREALNNQTFRTAGRNAFFRYTEGVAGDGQRTRLAPQFFFYTGSFGLLGEHFTTRQKIRKDALTTTDEITGFNLQASYVLTGEATSFRNVVPRHPFDPATGKGGAYEVAVRYAQVRNDGTTFRLGFANPASSAEKASAWTVGMNWYATRQVKAKVNFERTDFGRSLAFSSGKQRVENAILAELQLGF